MEIRVRTGTISEIVRLSQEIPEFTEPYTEREYRIRLQANPVILVAEADGQPAGFKAGYDRFGDGQTFYSWMGGVHPDFRKMGVARLLLQKMEVWGKLKGYRFLTFKTLNRHRSMMRFAIRQGFYIVDFKAADDPSRSKIYFQKEL